MPEATQASATVSDAGVDASSGPWLSAIVLQAPVWSEMEGAGERKRAERETNSTLIGYLRYGEKTPTFGESHPKPNCMDGWYELRSGGYVCGKFVTLDLDHPRVKIARAPDLDGPLPYTYGTNYASGTPLYRHVPSREQRKLGEPWAFRPRKPKTTDDDPGTSSAGASDGATPDASANDPDADIPWWEKQAPDGGAATPPNLEDLAENTGPIARRMVKGFFLSLDSDYQASGARWWKTVAGLYAPADRILVSKPSTEFHGVWLGRDEATFATKNVPARRIDKLPIAFVLTRSAKRWSIDQSRKQVSLAEGALDRFDAIGLTGEVARVGGVEYWETDEGWWLRATDGTKTEPGPPPERLLEDEKWIDVNLKAQTLVAFVGSTPTFATIVSSGRNEHETSPGSFRIRAKHITATMDADADEDTAADGPYSIEDVPYIQYFNAGYALHGAFWHASFGSIKSHGCVNLSPWDAKALFAWTEPALPPGWHAIFATKDRPGTRVVVHERAAGTCKGPSIKPVACP